MSVESVNDSEELTTINHMSECTAARSPVQIYNSCSCTCVCVCSWFRSNFGHYFIYLMLVKGFLRRPASDKEHVLRF